jgi:hypothetical protein
MLEDGLPVNLWANWRMQGLLVLFVCGVFVVAAGQSPSEQGQTQAAPPPLVIENDSQLPDTYPRASYEYQFHARGGVPTLRWKLEKGALPPGLKLESNGSLHGQPEHAGEFQFTISVKDGSEQAVQKPFILRVRSALTLNWKTPAHVSGNRIDGSVDVSNTTPDDMDLTYVVMAVAGNGRATAIGYQHFVLTRGTTDMELPFGETLPNGGYVVHVDVVGEVAKKNLIYRERMQTPSPLHVIVGP